jgi:hypothetical protein
MSDPTRPYAPLTYENAALVLIDHQVGLGSRLFDRRAEAQRGRAGQSGQGPEIADHSDHHRARQHVGSDLSGTRGGAAWRSDQPEANFAHRRVGHHDRSAKSSLMT